MRGWFPHAALDWLIGDAPRILNIGGSRMLTSLLTDARREVFWTHPDPSKADPRVRFVAAHAEHLPFEPMQFDAVTMHDCLHQTNCDLALPQVARALRPHGRLAVSTLTRDDSVPWVRRLAMILRRFDPMAMSGDYGHFAIDHVRRSKYFRDLDTRTFRVWQPITRAGLAGMVTAQPLARALDEASLTSLLDEVRSLYDDSARPAENLHLPFQLLCWRAEVAHSELTTPIRRPEPGLQIPL